MQNAPEVIVEEPRLHGRGGAAQNVAIRPRRLFPERREQIRRDGDFAHGVQCLGSLEHGARLPGGAFRLHAVVDARDAEASAGEIEVAVAEPAQLGKPQARAEREQKPDAPASAFLPEPAGERLRVRARHDAHLPLRNFREAELQRLQVRELLRKRAQKLLRKDEDQRPRRGGKRQRGEPGRITVHVLLRNFIYL